MEGRKHDPGPPAAMGPRCVLGPGGANDPGAARRGLLLILLMGLVSTLSNLMTISAFRLAQVQTLSPFVYLELIGASALGFVLFGDLPSPATWVGIAVIVLAGLIVATAPPPRRRI